MHLDHARTVLGLSADWPLALGRVSSRYPTVTREDTELIRGVGQVSGGACRKVRPARTAAFSRLRLSPDASAFRTCVGRVRSAVDAEGQTVGFS